MSKNFLTIMEKWGAQSTCKKKRPAFHPEKRGNVLFEGNRVVFQTRLP
jgi:hypothetical protein